ncbi:D-xylose-proton symporter-like 3, chloroplastic [Morella rubra]|uniref:D-xylose-proton symporter-like 3, chloroplastic n=1 Tax=Morella rubra TaxID=262757 RepID=A0A6A1UMF8_9ROSI|nr:D-xylose-proton symporter-like 3, chloroplastic [Morella rubra]
MSLGLLELDDRSSLRRQWRSRILDRARPRDLGHSELDGWMMTELTQRMQSIMLPTHEMLGYFVGSFQIDVVGGWRYMFGVSAPVALIMGLGMWSLPPSPRWLLLRAVQGKGLLEDYKDKAILALSKLRGRPPGDKLSKRQIEDNVVSLKSVYAEEDSEGSFLEVFQGPSLKAFIIGGGLVLFQQACIWGLRGNAVEISRASVTMVGNNMDKSWIYEADRLKSAKYSDGVRDFMSVARSYADSQNDKMSIESISEVSNRVVTLEPEPSSEDSEGNINDDMRDMLEDFEVGAGVDENAGENMLGPEKRRSAINKENRAKLKIVHTSGARKIQNLMRLVLRYFIKKTHTNKDGMWTSEDARKNFEKMEALQLQHESEGKSYTEVEIFAEVLGTKAGYVRGLGRSVRSVGSSSSASFFDLSRRLEEARLQIEEMRARQLEYERFSSIN